MDRLTMEYCGEYVPRELCSIDRLGGADDCDLCYEYCKRNEDCSGCAINKCFNRLGEYEDLEEQGKLLKLPCAVGDIAYRINKGAKSKLIAMRVQDVKIFQVGDILSVKIGCVEDVYGGECNYLAEEIGRKVFLTREGAEAALKGLEGKKE